MSRAGHPTAATLVLRAGALLISIGLALLLVSWMSSWTIGAASSQLQTNNSGVSIEVPPRNFYTAYPPQFASPKNVVEFRAVGSNGPLNVTFYSLSVSDVARLEVNRTIYYNDTSCLGGECSYTFTTNFGNLSLLASQLGRNHTAALATYSALQRKILDVRLYPADIEPVVVLIINPTNAPVNFTYWDTLISVQVSPPTGYAWAGAMLVPGAILVIAGIAWKRNEEERPSP